MKAINNYNTKERKLIRIKKDKKCFKNEKYIKMQRKKEKYKEESPNDFNQFFFLDFEF